MDNQGVERMITDDIVIEPLTKEAIPLLRDFAPPEWNSPLDRFLTFHWGQPYFQAWIARLDGQITGVGNIIRHETSGWLGNIIVAPPFRRQGLGQGITEHLIDQLRAAGRKSLLLVATAMGEPVYRRIGFEVSVVYRFFKGEPPPMQPDSALRPLVPADRAAALELDRIVSGEERTPLVSRFLETGWVYQADPGATIRGVFLPAFAMGLVSALDEEAGLTLLKFKLAHNGGKVVIPEANKAAIGLARQLGFQEYLAAPRMHLGPEVPWQPHLVFSRASGYCG